MSAMEPPTTAKVILNTTKGPLEIELWAKECPLACRNFLQLCLENYYNTNQFFLVVKDFIIQSGDPTNTGNGGESIYLDSDNKDTGFKNEFHPRLRFNRRGLLGFANINNVKNSNNSQFFITLAPTPELNGKNTMFGRIVGNTIYNALKIADTETDEHDRPYYPAVIKDAEVIVKYFEDLTPRIKKQVDKPIKTHKKEKKINLKKVKLSFNDDDDEEEDDPPLKKFKIKPSKPVKKVTRKAKVDHDSDSESHSDLNSKQTPLETKKPFKDNPKGSPNKFDDNNDDENDSKPESNSSNSALPAHSNIEPTTSKLESINSEIEALKASIRKPKSIETSKMKQKNISLLEKQRQEYLEGTNKAVRGLRKAGKTSKSKLATQKEMRELQTLAKLDKFKAKLTSFNFSNDDKDQEENEDNTFLTHRLQFEDNPDNFRLENEDLLVTIDPKKAKEKL